MSITNLLARGFDPMPAGGQANALMQVQQFKDAKLKNALLQAQMQDAQTARQMQMAELQRNALLKQERDGYLASLQPVSGINANAASGITGPRPEALAVVGQRPKIDPAKAMRVGLSEEQIKFLASADTLGMPEVARTIEEAGQNGAPQTVQFDKFGRRVGGGIAKPVQMSMQDLGGTVQPVNPFTQTAPLTKTMTPDGRDASARGWASVGLQREDLALKKEAAATGKTTVEERNAAGFTSRMIEATKLLDKFEKDGKATDWTNFAGAIPLVGSAARTRASTAEQQQYRQAQEDWVRAKLRKESGAAIGVDEMENEIKTYFPQPGELDGVVAQKRRARAIATEGMQMASGKAVYKSAVPADARVSLNPIFDAADAIIGVGNGKR